MVPWCIPYTLSMSDLTSIPKSRTPVWVYLLLLAVTAFFLLGFAGLIKDIIIQYQGRLEVATVTEVPVSCKSKFANNIKVRVDNKTYPYPITKSECLAGKYNTGQQLRIRRYAAFDKVIAADDRPDYMLAIYLAWLAAFFFTIRYFWRRYRKARGY